MCDVQLTLSFSLSSSKKGERNPVINKDLAMISGRVTINAEYSKNRKIMKSRHFFKNLNY